MNQTFFFILFILSFLLVSSWIDQTILENMHPRTNHTLSPTLFYPSLFPLELR